MAEPKLPPAPWRVERTKGQVVGFKDAGGRFVFGGGGYIDASPEVIRAVLKLPELLALVEAARGAMEASKNPADPYRAWKLLRDALALVDGEYRAGPQGEITPP